MSDTKKKKLLVLSSTYPRWDDDWEPAFVHELSKRLTSDFDVTVLCPREKGSVRKETKDKVNVQRYRYAPNWASTLVSNGGIAANLKNQRLKWFLVPFFFLAQTLTIIIAIKRHKPDVIHCHWIIPQGVCLYLAKKITRSKIPHLLTSHGGDLYTFRGKLLTKLKQAVLCHASSITVVSQAMTKEAKRISGNALDISVIPMGIDTRHRFFPDIGERNSEPEILFVGRLVEKKGVHHLIEAFAKVAIQYPAATLTIIGDGPERNKLEAQAGKLQPTNKINFLGSLRNSELPQFYRRAAVFVAPFITATSGDQEGLGLVLAEAISCGTPAIVSNIEAVNSIHKALSATHAITLIDPKNQNDLSLAITSRLRNRTVDFTGAHEIIRGMIDWEVILISYKNALNKVIAV